MPPHEFIDKLKPKNSAFEDLLDHENLGRGSSEEKETADDDDLVSVFDSQDSYRPKVVRRGKLGGLAVPEGELPYPLQQTDMILVQRGGSLYWVAVGELAIPTPPSGGGYLPGNAMPSNYFPQGYLE